MEVIGLDKVKRSMARRMINAELQRLAHKTGKTGRIAARLDSLMSRTLDRGKGVYQ